MFLNISIILLNTAFDDTNTHFTGKHGRNIMKRKAQNKARQEKKVLNESTYLYYYLCNHLTQNPYYRTKKLFRTYVVGADISGNGNFTGS